MGFVKNGPLVTSSRRRVTAFVFKLKEKIQFGDQSKEKDMRNLNLDSFPIFDYANKDALNNLRKDLEHAINQLIDNYEEGEKLGKSANYYKSNLKKVGIEYELDNNEIIHITDLSKFIERQEIMQKLIKGGEKNMAKVIEKSWEI